MPEPQDAFEAEVLTDAIVNLGVAKGAPFMLLRRADGAYALAQKVGDQVFLTSDWCAPQKILDGALRVVGGDPAALTHPKALLHVSIALVGVFLEAERRRMKKEAQG